jgi:predicted anti-sigma-YlaC factor YlaD
MTTPDTSTVLALCPTSEDIAAFLDGTAGRERTRLASHLADCESCYELFAGVAHFLGELAAPVLPLS